MTYIRLDGGYKLGPFMSVEITDNEAWAWTTPTEGEMIARHRFFYWKFHRAFRQKYGLDELGTRAIVVVSE